MTNFNKMTIRQNGSNFEVFKMRSQRLGGYVTDMAGKKFVWYVPAFKPRFVGTHAECHDFIIAQGGEFMSEHGLAI